MGPSWAPIQTHVGFQASAGTFHEVGQSLAVRCANVTTLDNTAGEIIDGGARHGFVETLEDVDAFDPAVPIIRRHWHQDAGTIEGYAQNGSVHITATYERAEEKKNGISPQLRGSQD